MNFDVIRNIAYDKKQLLEELEEHKKLLLINNKKYQTAVDVQVMFQETIKSIQNKLKFFIDDINQQALNITFPGYKFHMDFTIKNNVSHAGIYVENHGKPQKPMASNGGGLGNVIALCSQMGSKKMTNTRDVIFADQPMKDVSPGNKEELVMEMLKTLTKDMGIQYIMISHITSQIEAADKTIKVSIHDNEELGYPVSKIS
jgi:DNA repair exonuclease SbcCD ATPase subunit